jgi:hypothetical protein
MNSRRTEGAPGRPDRIVVRRFVLRPLLEPLFNTGLSVNLHCFSGAFGQLHIEALQQEMVRSPRSGDPSNKRSES